MLEYNYKELFLQKIKESMYATVNCKKFLEEFKVRARLFGAICARIATLIGISITDAGRYINVTTGRFKPDGYMSHCYDAKLKEYFTELEIVTTKINKTGYTFKEQAIQTMADKQNAAKDYAAKLRRELGPAKAQVIIDETVAKARMPSLLRTCLHHLPSDWLRRSCLRHRAGCYGGVQS